MILPPRPIVEPEIGDLSALNSTTMRSDRGFANLWPRASKLHRRDRTAWLSKRSALMLVIAASLRMVHELAAISPDPKMIHQYHCSVCAGLPSQREVCVATDTEPDRLAPLPPASADGVPEGDGS
jgi:hypothetical protein